MIRYPCRVGCPIRISTDQSLLAAPRGFSQRATSFIASWCQGIHRMPLSYSDPDCQLSEAGVDSMHGNQSSGPTWAGRRRVEREVSHVPSRDRPCGSQSSSAQNPDVSPFLEENGRPSGSIHTHASEPSLSDLGAHARPRTPKQGLRHTRRTLPVRHQPDNGSSISFQCQLSESTTHSELPLITRAQRRTRT